MALLPPKQGHVPHCSIGGALVSWLFPGCGWCFIFSNFHGLCAPFVRLRSCPHVSYFAFSCSCLMIFPFDRAFEPSKIWKAKQTPAITVVTALWPLACLTLASPGKGFFP
uniref:Uncharacterized protein n=1 Tax=Mus musculus TaxID=10090 RepID=Q8C9T3_MOUSE|nr:unnamed protein product [Mus musculus]